MLLLIYLVLLIPEPADQGIKPADNQVFIWDRDSLWHALEESFALAKKTGCDTLSPLISRNLEQLYSELVTLRSSDEDYNPFLPEEIINRIFLTAPLIAACPDSALKYIGMISIFREIIKEKSLNWNPNEPGVRNLLYKTIYGGRGAAEEILLQLDDNNSALIYGKDEPSATPFTTFMGVKIHSGDILVSRGGAPTSALISRGSDYPGNFSHVALVYVDPETNIASIIESHIEIGVAVASLNEYIKDKKLRVMVLRPRADLPELTRDPMLPHKAAEAALRRALIEHIAYDFEMDYNNPDKLFCSEVASSVYKKYGITLWMGKSTISSPGTAGLLAGFGVRYFETQEPSDLEYDPQLSVVAEWRDPETLYLDHIDNAVVDAILEWSDLGNEIKNDWYLLPLYRVVKFYSYLLNLIGEAGPVPEGMSAASALRHEAFRTFHSEIKNSVLEQASLFRNKEGYIAPYWRLLEFARNYLNLSP